MSEQNLRATLEAVKSLKGEYYIGSRSAYKYLKAVRWFEELRSSAILRHPKNRALRTLTIPQFMVLVFEIQNWATHMLDLCAAEESSTKNWSVLSEHYILPPVCLPHEGTEGFGIGEHVWELNWNRVMNGVAMAFEAGQENVEGEEWHTDEEHVLKGNFILILIQILVIGEMFRYRGNEQWISLSEVRRKPDLMTPNMTWQESLSAIGDDAILTDDERILFEQGCSGDQAKAHDFFQRYHKSSTIRILDHLIEEWVEGNVKYNQREVEQWVYDDYFFERASREQVLGRIEVERRIALNIISEYDLEKDGQPDTFIDQRIDEARSNVQKWIESIEHHRALGFPVSFAEDMLEKSRYRMLSLRHNRKWLIDFLSH